MPPTIESEFRETPAPRAANVVPTIVIAGNPNSGKSTLFNALTGLRQKVANYPGVTVEKKSGRFHGSHGEPLDLLDLPGAYSLQTRSPDEVVTRDVLLGRRDDTPQPDVIVCVVDATNLERNLYLVAQLAELGLPLVVALNMMDLAERNGVVIDPNALATRLACPVIPCVASQRKGLVELRQAITRQLDGSAPNRAPLPEALEQAAIMLGEVLVRDQQLHPRFAFAEALLLITATGEAAVAALPAHLRPALEDARRTVERSGIARVSAAVNARYAWVHEIAIEASHSRSGCDATVSDRLDTWLTHKFWGWIFFLGVMTVMFFTIFRVAEIPMGWIETGKDAVTGWIKAAVPAGDFQDLLTNGIVSGVGGVVIFLPQILILFFFIGLLEDTGYMARAAFIIDRLMNRVGLHGEPASHLRFVSQFHGGLAIGHAVRASASAKRLAEPRVGNRNARDIIRAIRQRREPVQTRIRIPGDHAQIGIGCDSAACEQAELCRAFPVRDELQVVNGVKVGDGLRGGWRVAWRMRMHAEIVKRPGVMAQSEPQRRRTLGHVVGVAALPKQPQVQSRFTRPIETVVAALIKAGPAVVETQLRIERLEGLHAQKQTRRGDRINRKGCMAAA